MTRLALVLTFLFLLLGFGSMTQARQDASAIELGGFTGLLWFSDTGTLSELGATMGYSISRQFAFTVSYWHAGVSFLGMEILGIDAVDAVLTFDFSPDKRFGFYVLGGLGYLLAGMGGEGIDGIMVTTGAGLRIRPLSTVKIYAEYRPLIRFGVLHTIRAGISMYF